MHSASFGVTTLALAAGVALAMPGSASAWTQRTSSVATPAAYAAETTTVYDQGPVSNAPVAYDQTYTYDYAYSTVPQTYVSPALTYVAPDYGYAADYAYVAPAEPAYVVPAAPAYVVPRTAYVERYYAPPPAYAPAYAYVPQAYAYAPPAYTYEAPSYAYVAPPARVAEPIYASRRVVTSPSATAIGRSVNSVTTTRTQPAYAAQANVGRPMAITADQQPRLVRASNVTMRRSSTRDIHGGVSVPREARTASASADRASMGPRPMRHIAKRHHSSRSGASHR